MQLTPSQKKALSVERHLAVIANAGSGKTRVLVKRYVDLFERYDDLSTRNVVAITFTENAAAELRKRIADEVQERLSALPLTERGRRGALLRLRDSLPNAFIATIHGFAARILRAYPVEANIDANFTITTGADQRLMLEDAIGRIFYKTLENAYRLAEAEPTAPADRNSQTTAMLRLFRTFGRQVVTELVRTLLQNRARSRRVQKDLLAKSDEAVLEVWQGELERVLARAVSDRTAALLAELTPYFKPGVRGQEMVSLLAPYSSATGFFERASAFFAAMNALVTGQGTINSHRVKVDELPAGISFALSDLVAWFKRTNSLLACCPRSQTDFYAEHREYLTYLRTVFALFDDVLSEYNSFKTNEALLDFDDLIDRLMILLENSEIRAELSKELRFLMIDEYQDTDESQFTLAHALTQAFGSENNLAVVGDPKQAIYTFRNADAEVFAATTEAIRSQAFSVRAGEESIRLGLSAEEERGSILLGETFRMTRAPISAINRLFRTVLPAAAGAVSNTVVEYSDLVHGRTTTLPGTVEWLCPPAPSKTKASAPEDGENSGDEISDSIESELIARKIREMVGNDSYSVERDGDVRQAQYSNIAIVVRSRNGLPELERALREANIPYSVSKGAGFYKQPEIQDIASYLTFLTRPADDIALAAILRSPFFSISDDQLFQVSHYNRAQGPSAERAWTFWDQLQHYATAHDAPLLRRAIRELRENLALAGRTSTAFLVEKIYAESAIFATLLRAPQGQQKIANLEKFLSRARTSDMTGFSSLFDFIDRIQYLTDSEEQESQADLPDDTSNAVQIMTVHAAKGLEFPIVIVPFLQKKFKFDHRNLLDKQLGLQLQFEGRERQPLISALIRERSRANVIQEEKRILYVAMTRARDHLVLSSALPERPQDNSWLAWVSDVFGLPREGEEYLFEERIEIYDGDSEQRHSETFTLRIPLIRSASQIPNDKPQNTKVQEKRTIAFHLEALPVLHPIGRYSATQLLRHAECPTKYFLSYSLGMPEDAMLPFEHDEEYRSDRTSGTVLGRLVHATMDRIDTLAPLGELDRDRFDRTVGSLLPNHGIREKKEQTHYSNEVNAHISRFLASEVGKEVLRSGDAHTEYALQATLADGDILYGIIDRLYRNAEGIWTVLDYKTEASERKEKSLGRYTSQLRFYAYLVHLFDPTAAQVNAVLFYTATGESVFFEFSTNDFETFEQECKAQIEQIRSDELVPRLDLLTRNTEHCPECRYFEKQDMQCIVLTASKADGNAQQITHFAYAP